MAGGDDKPVETDNRGLDTLLEDIDVNSRKQFGFSTGKIDGELGHAETMFSDPPPKPGEDSSASVLKTRYGNYLDKVPKEVTLEDIHSEARYVPDYTGKAEGGMSATLIHTAVSGGGHEHEVIIKRSKTDKGGERIKSEAMILSCYQACPMIVDFKDSGHDGNTHYLVMEYMRGRQLEEMGKLHDQKKWVIPEEIIASIFLDMAQGINYMHTNPVYLEIDEKMVEFTTGVVHRDIKPGNTFLTLSGIAKIFDFDLAAAVDDKRENPFPMNEKGHRMIAGTPIFMPYEGFAGVKLGHGYDIATLHSSISSLACGYVFNQPNAKQINDIAATEIIAHLSMVHNQVVNEHKELELRNIGDVVPHINSDLGEIISSGMAFDGSKRPSAYETVAKLGDWFMHYAPHMAANRHDVVGAYALYMLSKGKENEILKKGPKGIKVLYSLDELAGKTEDQMPDQVYLDIPTERITDSNALPLVRSLGEKVQRQKTPFVLGENAKRFLETYLSQRLPDFKRKFGYTPEAQANIAQNKNPLFINLD